jgi:hypothetical protein
MPPALLPLSAALRTALRRIPARQRRSGKNAPLSPVRAREPRSRVLQLIWAYIRWQGLLSGRTVRCDATLRGLFSVDSVPMLQLQRHLTPHLTPPARAAQSSGVGHARADLEASSVVPQHTFLA